MSRPVIVLSNCDFIIIFRRFRKVWGRHNLRATLPHSVVPPYADSEVSLIIDYLNTLAPPWDFVSKRNGVERETLEETKPDDGFGD